MAVFSLHLLGDPVLRGPGGVVTGRASYRRRIALLSVLAVARGRPVGRERILGLLWAEFPTEAARHTLSESLYVLRKDISDDLFLAVGDELALNRAVMECDVDAFEAALEAHRPEDAVRAYAGPLLDGFGVSDAPEFERWVDGERGRLARAFAQALEGLALGAEAGGDFPAAVGWWRRLAAHDPYSSRVALRLVRALDASGDRMAALRFAGTHAVLLREELGAEPDHELTQLVERLRTEPIRIPPVPELPAAPAVPAAEEGPAGAEDGDAPPPSPESPAPVLDPPPGVPAEPAAETPSSGTLPRERSRADWFRPRLVTLLGAAAIVAGVAIGLAAAKTERPAAPHYDPRRIAVLYLDDYSPEGELGYLANGLTEMLIHHLSQVEALDVVSRNGVKPYRDHPVPFDSMAADLRAGSVVEGSVQRSGDSVRVTIQLIDANSQAHLESRSIVRPLGPGNLFALQDAVAGEVTAFLRRRVGREIRLSTLRREARDPAAFDLVLRAQQARDDGREMARSTHARDVASALRMLASADSMLERAERLEPRWAEPALLRGWTALERGKLLRGPSRLAAMDTARARAETILRRDPASLDARELRGSALWQMVLAASGDPAGRAWLAGAERDLRAVLEADPGRASAWVTLGQLLRLGGDLAAAGLATRRGREEDAYLDVPDVGADQLYRAALVLGDFARARFWCDEGRRQFPGDFHFRDCPLVLLALDPAGPARPDSAWRLLAVADSVDPPATAAAGGRQYWPIFRRMMVAAVVARAGLPDSARAMADRARRQAASDADSRVSFLWDDAYVAVILGDTARSATLLRRYVAARPSLAGYVAREPAFRGVWRP